MGWFDFIACKYNIAVFRTGLGWQSNHDIRMTKADSLVIVDKLTFSICLNHHFPPANQLRQAEIDKKYLDF